MEHHSDWNKERENAAWNIFVRTGKIEAYLRYRAIRRSRMDDDR